MGLDRDCARDAQALLLPPDRPSAESRGRSLTCRAALRSARSTRASMSCFMPRLVPPCDVVVDRLRKRVRRLEHHPDPASDLHGVDARRVHVVAVVQDLAADLEPGDRIVLRGGGRHTAASWLETRQTKDPWLRNRRTAARTAVRRLRRTSATASGAASGAATRGSRSSRWPRPRRRRRQLRGRPADHGSRRASASSWEWRRCCWRSGSAY